MCLSRGTVYALNWALRNEKYKEVCNEKVTGCFSGVFDSSGPGRLRGLGWPGRDHLRQSSPREADAAVHRQGRSQGGPHRRPERSPAVRGEPGRDRIRVAAFGNGRADVLAGQLLAHLRRLGQSPLAGTTTISGPPPSTGATTTATKPGATNGTAPTRSARRPSRPGGACATPGCRRPSWRPSPRRR